MKFLCDTNIISELARPQPNAGVLQWSREVSSIALSVITLEEIYKIASKAQWKNLAEVQAVYSQAESVGNFTVFNIKGNRYRLIVDIVYKDQVIYIKYILTHAEYDKDEWKNDSYFGS
jgi:mRNA interferase HigB